MNYGFDDEGILDEDADFSYVPSRRNPQPVTTKTAAASKPAAASSAAPKVKSNLNYDDFGFSDDDLDKPSASKPSQQVAAKKPDPIIPSTSTVVPRVRGGASAKAAHVDDDIFDKGSSDQLYVPSLPEKRVERSKQASALPPISSSLQASVFEDDKDSKARKPSALGSVAQMPSMNLNNISSSNNNNNSNVNDKKKAIQKKQESDFEDDLDDLDDIVAASSLSPSPPKKGVSVAASVAVAKTAELEAEKKRKEDEAKKKKEQEEKDRVAKQKKQQQEQEELERQQQKKKREQEELEKKQKNSKAKKVEDDNFEEDLYEEAYEQDDEDFEVDNFKSSNKKNNSNNYPTSNQKHAKDEDEESELSDLPELEYDDDPKPNKKSAPQSANFLHNPIALENRSTRLESPLPNLSQNNNQANRAKERKLTNESKTSKATVNRTQLSKDTRIKPPQYPHQKKAKQEEDELKELLRDRDYNRMTYKEIKAENDALREKLRAFNQKLTEKIDQSKYQIEKQAIQNSMMSNQPRSRSNQMRTVDAEQDNNLKIIKRLEDELNKLEQRKALLEDPKYLTNLKLQIETSQNLINKFKAQAKQTSLKNDFQAKELSKISQDSGVTDGVKEGHGIQKDLQLVLERTSDLERKLLEFEDLFSRKNEAIDAREVEYQKKVKEAKSLGVSLNLDLNHSKRVAKYKELAKILDQWEKSNTTLTKMHKTKEALFLREMDELAKNITGKDDEINDIDSNLVGLKMQVQDTIENEKIYPNHRNMKSFFGPTAGSKPESAVIAESHSPNPSNNVSARKGNHVQQSISPTKPTADLKPQMKFKKFTGQTEQEGSRGTIQEEKQQSPTLKTSQSGINFHQKMNPRGNLNDISNQEENKSIQSKPFSLKKGAAVSEARIWKPEEPLDSLSNNNNNPSSFNFKQKQQAPAQTQNQQEVPQENIKPYLSSVTASNENQSEDSSAFEKPQRMFKFKRGEGAQPSEAKPDNQISAFNPSIAAPTAAANSNNNTTTTDAAPVKDEGYSFSTNSRVTRVRGGLSNNKDSSTTASASIPEEPSKLGLGSAEIGKSKPAEQDSVVTKPTNNTSDSSSIGGGYSFSGLGAGTGTGATVSRRRGNQPSAASAFDDDFKLGTNNNNISNVQPVQQPQQNQPTSLASKQDDAFDINVPSRRNRGAAAKNDSYDPLSNGFGFGGKKDEEPIKKVVEEENKWGWNATSNANANTNAASNNNKSNDAALKGVGSTGSALDTPFNFNSDPAPKTFNFKRNPVNPPSDTAAVIASTSNVNVTAATNATADKSISQQPVQQQQQQQPVVQSVKKEDVMFKGPNDKRISNNRPANANNNDAKKVIKRNIFGDEPEEIVAPAAGNGFLAPKEIGTAAQQPAVATVAAANKGGVGGAKKSALDDDLDDDGGLDFLKENKPKVNYNDDDDIFSKSKKPATNNQQPTTSIQGPSKMSIGVAGGAKPQDNAKQEREKNLASKAKNEDFFDDLF